MNDELLLANLLKSARELFPVNLIVASHNNKNKEKGE